MTSGRRCQECGTEIPAGSPGGLCGRCLFALGLGEVQSPESKVQSLKSEVQDAQSTIDTPLSDRAESQAGVQGQGEGRPTFGSLQGSEAAPKGGKAVLGGAESAAVPLTEKPGD